VTERVRAVNRVKRDPRIASLLERVFNPQPEGDPEADVRFSLERIGWN